MPFDLSVLRTELSTDPNGYGYAPYLATGNDWAVAAGDILRCQVESAATITALSLILEFNR